MWKYRKNGELLGDLLSIEDVDRLLVTYNQPPVRGNATYLQFLYKGDRIEFEKE